MTTNKWRKADPAGGPKGIDSPGVALKTLPPNTWVRLNPDGPPDRPRYRGLSGAVWCSEQGCLFFWGASLANSGGSKYYAELFDPIAGIWRKVGPARAGSAQAGPPLKLTYAMLVYEPATGRVIFSSISADPARSRTWAFDLAAGKWIDLKTKAAPRVVPNSAAVYDSKNKLIVLFGGPFDREPQTWLYDPARNTWTNAKPAMSPPARIWHDMTFDAKAGLVVLFGGHDGKRELGDTWAYDAAANRWRKLKPKASPPPASIVSGAMTYDIRDDMVLLMHPWKPRWPWSKKYNTSQVRRCGPFAVGRTDPTSPAAALTPCAPTAPDGIRTRVAGLKTRCPRPA